MKTRRYNIILLIVLTTSTFSFGGNNQNIDSLFGTKNIVRLNLLAPSFGFEKCIGNNFTIRPEAGFGWPVFTNDKDENGNNQINMESMVNPYLLLEGRYYYDLQKRLDRGKSISNYTGNYIACFYRYNAYEYQAGVSNRNSEYLLRDVQYMGIWWGMQRNLGQKELFYFNWSLGPSIKTNWKDYADGSFTGQLSLGLQWN